MARHLPVLLAAAAALGGVSVLSAAEPDWGQARRVNIDLSSFKFAPRDIQLKAGEPVVLHLANTSSGGHDFTAREFFAAATLRQGDAAKIEKGSIEFAGGQNVDVALVPKAGRYAVRCGHAFHSTFGMKGSITVR
jgi:uncharacterized cupredoxin-like copper-binding protein